MRTGACTVGSGRADGASSEETDRTLTLNLRSQHNRQRSRSGSSSSVGQATANGHVGISSKRRCTQALFLAHFFSSNVPTLRLCSGVVEKKAPWVE